MSVKLVSVTQPLIDGLKTAEDLIVYCARVSNPENQLNTLTVPRLLKHCIKHEHWSVFEQADMTLEIKTSRDISPQILRHKTFSFQEFSQRYSVVTKIVPFELRKQSEKNRQSSTDPLVLDEETQHRLDAYLEEGMDLYGTLIEKGAAKECSRKVLPMCVETTMYMKGTVRSWIHYIKVRTRENTQKEHREIAKAAFAIFKQQFPVIAACLEDKQATHDIEFSPMGRKQTLEKNK